MDEVNSEMSVTGTSKAITLPLQVSDAQLESALVSVRKASPHPLASPQQISQAQLKSALTNLQEALNPNEELMRELDNILKNKPDQVRRTIHSLINHELQRSYVNVADQIRNFKIGLEKFVALETSEDMRNLRQMLQQLKDSDLRALEREASNIDSHANDMVRCIQERDFGSLQQIARVMENCSDRFIDKYNKLNPLLRKLAENCEELQEFFREGREKSQSLAKETADRQDKYFSLFKGIGLATGALSVGVLVASVHTCIVTIMAMNAAHVKAKLAQGAANAAAGKASAAQHAAQATQAHHSIWRSLRDAGAKGVGAAGVGFAGASLLHIFAVPVAVGIGATVASIVAAKDIQAGKAAYATASAKASAAAKTAAVTGAAAASATQTSTVAASTCAATVAVFQPMAITSGVVVALFLLGCAGRRQLKTLLGNLWKKEIELHLQTAEAYKAIEEHMREVAAQLHATEESNAKLLEALDLVRETAQEMAERAEDAEQVSPPAGPQAERMLERYVEELSTLVDAIRERTVLVLPAVIEMQTRLNLERPKPLLQGSFSPPDGHGNSGLSSEGYSNLEFAKQGILMDTTPPQTGYAVMPLADVTSDPDFVLMSQLEASFTSSLPMLEPGVAHIAESEASDSSWVVGDSSWVCLSSAAGASSDFSIQMAYEALHSDP